MMNKSKLLDLAATIAPELSDKPLYLLDAAAIDLCRFYGFLNVLEGFNKIGGGNFRWFVGRILLHHPL